MRRTWFLHCVLDDLRVDPRHTVDSVRAHDAQVSHVDLLHVSFFNQGHAAQAVNVPWEQLGDALERVKDSETIFSTSMSTETTFITTWCPDWALTSRCLLLIS